MFPRTVERWRPLAAAAAARQGTAAGVGVPVELVLAIIQVESSGGPTVASLTRVEPDGRTSRGLMHVLGGTARELGLANPLNLYTPAVGIEIGTKYLARQLARYGGRVPHAAAAYNAGSATFTERERFTNQRYVDRVLVALRNAGAATALPNGIPAAVVLVLLGGLLAAAAGSRVRRAARAA